MNIIGYSGLHDSLAFRRENFKNFTGQEYRMCQGLDSAACILVNGRIIAAVEEERFNGEKYTCDFPSQSIDYCLKEAGLVIEDIDFICHGFDYSKYEKMYALDPVSVKYYKEILSPESQKKLWKKFYPSIDVEAKFIAVSHHLSHAASTFYPSGFKDALIVICDGLGEEHSVSIFHGRERKIELLKEYNIFSSLGILYSQVTAHLGFLVNSDEYKVMGLAPYGNPDVYDDLFTEIIEYRSQGEIMVSGFDYNKTPLEKQTCRGFREWLALKTFKERESSEPIEQAHKDLAATLQKHLEKSMQHIISHWKGVTRLHNLCLAGGVALNCVSNGLLLRKQWFENIYVPSAAGDAGTSLGAAFIKLYKDNDALVTAGEMDLPYYGSDITDENCALAIRDFSDKIVSQKLSDEVLFDTAASYIAQGKIIAWVQGRMEFGPRALGNRSILADPCCPDMRRKINALVKKRESFRPFAPAVVLEAAKTYFDVPEGVELPYMLFTVPVRKIYQDKLPAITHVNGSARVQTVNKKYSPKFWRLINSLSLLNRFPIVLNTSFNVKGQPIVRTPVEAIETLISANLDALFLGNYLIVLKE